MNFGGFVDGRPQQPLPEVLASRMPELNAFQEYCNNLMLKILTLLAVGLKVRLLVTTFILGYPNLESSETVIRLTQNLVEETGSHHATKADPAAAPFVSLDILTSHQIFISTLQSIFAPEPTQITAPSLYCSNDRDNRASRSSRLLRRSQAREIPVTMPRGCPSLSLLLAQNPIPVLPSWSISETC